MLGNKDVASIDTADVLAVFRPIWATKHETATRLRQRIEAVLTAAKVRGLRNGENPAAWRGHLAALLPAIPKKARVRLHPALDWREVPAFITELRQRHSMSARALEFTILTACRTNEVIGARWGEIDLDAAIWTIPGERMKAKIAHRVALSADAIALLSALPRHDASPPGVLDASPGRAPCAVEHGDAGITARHVPGPDRPRLSQHFPRLGRGIHAPSARDHRACAGASNPRSG
ncbi:MAG: tyrosine-type recombinase/integrase [Betaproteobacteria bacterium]|nr:tyrosine-type recombinase/integrase [Betaproteobacteria bacterium]